ncbi:hypothetical protein AHiyo8_pI69110 (plasmid) [Arthrobacter sp. Hiyo8]|nr:hypothetical protein AHiyo8_pI69110 [Arthrobacter sp. Hiyo8]
MRPRRVRSAFSWRLPISSAAVDLPIPAAPEIASPRRAVAVVAALRARMILVCRVRACVSVVSSTVSAASQAKRSRS